MRFTKRNNLTINSLPLPAKGHIFLYTTGRCHFLPDMPISLHNRRFVWHRVPSFFMFLLCLYSNDTFFSRDYLNREFIISWYIIGNILLVIFQLPLSNFQKLGIFYSQGRRIENTSSGRFIHCTSFLILLREFRILSLYDWNLSK